MKKIISITIALCIIIGSFSNVFAVATQWDSSDSTHLTEIRNSLVSTSGAVISSIRNIYDLLNSNTSNYSLYAIASYLYDIREAVTGTSSSGIAGILNSILAEFTSTNTGGAVTHFFANINTNLGTVLTRLGTIINTSFPNIVSGLSTLHSDNNSIISNTNDIKTNTNNIYSLENNTLPGIYAYSGSIDGTTLAIYNLDQLNGMEAFSSGTNVRVLGLASNGSENENFYNFSSNNWRSNLGRFAQYINNNLVRGFGFLTGGFNQSQTFTNWNGSALNTSSFTPSSTTNGLYSWLSKLQTPLARLAFVHASDEEIIARQKAAANQAAVVNDFIDPLGSGSVVPSDFGSLASASGSFENNFTTGQSSSGIWNVFDNSNFVYLSQSAADQLDTTGSNTRLLKSSDEDNYLTPALDNYFKELDRLMGVNTN